MAKRKDSLACLVATLTVVAVITIGSVQASPSYQPNSRYTANDLYPSPAELPTLSHKSLVVPPSGASSQNSNNDKQPQQQQQQRSPTLRSGPRAVINGNHATYVEPPADFKPIIYEPERQAASDPATVTSAGEGLAEHSNQLVPSRLSPAISSQQQFTSRQQQKRQTEAPPTMTLQEIPENQIIRAPDSGATSPTDATGADEEANSFPMKPSIDRWSDWTDMSVDPDLASSDTQLSPTSTLFNSKHNNQRKSAVPSRHVSALKWQSSRAQPQQQLDLIKTSGQAYDQTLSSSRFVPLNAHRRHAQDERMYLAPLAPSSTGNHMNMQYNPGQDYQAAGQLQLVANHGEALSYQPARPIYYILQQQQQQQQQQQPHNIQTGPVDEHRFDSFARSSSQGALLAQTQHHVMMPPPLVFAPQPPPPHMPVLLQRYGKKMANLFRVANNNQYYPMSLAKGGLKRLDGFKPSAVAQQNAEVRQLAASQGQRLSSPLVQLTAGQLSSGIDKSAHLGKRVSVGGIPTVNRVITPAANYAQGQRNQVKQQPQLSSNSTTTPPKRVLKRRRIKTLVPVGLSSWFLGGIRDLDARHWKLPADVISKLAVNDVDLAHSEQPTPFVGAPASQDELVNMSNQVQAGGSLEKADSPRASTTRSPTSQPLSPR